MPSVLKSPSRLERATPSSRSEPSAPALGSSPAWAVVSFIFEDAAWCDWLYSEFDGARIPRPLLGRPSRDGLPYPERVSISPDPSDSLQLENYHETLQTSQHLLVIVSPGSGHSPLLEEHLRTFKAAGGEERIIAVVVSGEPGSPLASFASDADREWLPKWLQWRFENNEFQPAAPSEPRIIDARPGVHSLAQVRSQLFAALLEVPVIQLGELGVILRSTPSECIIRAAQAASQAPIASPVAFTLPPPELKKHTRWPVFAFGFAALAALGALALWPTQNAKTAPPTIATSAVAESAPVNPEPIASEPHPNVPEEKTASVPLAEKTAPPQITAPPVAEAVPEPTPLVAPVAAALTTLEAEPSPEQEAAQRKYYELCSRRDRLVRMAERQIADADPDVALDTLEQALAAAQDAVRNSDGSEEAILELALIYRREGQLASAINSPAEGRSYYMQSRRTLLTLRSKGKLPKEAAKILGDLEGSLRRLPKD